MIKADDEIAVIKYRNGNVYEGPISRKVFHGKGKFVWANGTVYEVKQKVTLFYGFVFYSFEFVSRVISKTEQ